MDRAAPADVEPVPTCLSIAGAAVESLIPLFKLTPLPSRPVTLEPSTLILGQCVATFTAPGPIEDNLEELTQQSPPETAIRLSEPLTRDPAAPFRPFPCECLFKLKLPVFPGQVPPD